ncbi:MAG: primosomal protein N' [Kiritimatiellaeota bacterium]|nr:primosomal protein N' [Kiritimatiellota bacterium]
MHVAKVVVNLSLDREFDYRVPPALVDRVRVGSRVRVPFGRGKSVRTGYVVGLARESAYPKLKDVLAVEGEPELVSPKLLDLARWMAGYYCCAREQAVRALLPAVVRAGKVKRKTRKGLRLNPDKDLGEELPKLQKRGRKQAAVLQALVRHGGAAALITLKQETGASPAVFKRLVEKDLAVPTEDAVDRDPFADDVILPTRPLTPTGEQRKAIHAVIEAVQEHRFAVFLLHGVTGSGKTEVYLQTLSRVLELGREAIVLVPEISLTPQTCERFRARFGDLVSVLHSGLSDGERFDEWTRIHEGRAKVAVGARSALFAPFRNLGLIVVDEEHENTYKQDEAPRYHARDTAVVRAKLENVVVVLGSATPSLESFANAKSGKYIRLNLTRRVDGRRLPKMELVDMRAEAVLQGGARIFSRRLTDLIRERLENREQTILFLNRRGYATHLMCTHCGFVAECPDCSVAYTYHRERQQLVCHLCGGIETAPFVCPKCRDPEIRYTGLGTEKLEAVARNLFPKAVIARMDSDTMVRRNAYKKTLLAFRAGRIDILLGTQMIAKGLDFPKVTLVGIIFADLSLYIPDFRSGERTFQLLTQVAGRAGRGELPGRVLVQSYTPFHPALQAAMRYDWKAFYRDELEARTALGFPPAMHMVLIHFRGGDEQKVRAAAEEFAVAIAPALPADVRVAGPVPAPTYKIRGRYRYQLLLRTPAIVRLTRILRKQLIGKDAVAGDPDVEVYADVDPLAML